jgi:pilus assembly protein Flp/PilA
MTKLLSKLKASKSGASAAEYALIIAVFGVFVIAGVTLLGTGFEASMTDAKDTLENPPAP